MKNIFLKVNEKQTLEDVVQTLLSFGYYISSKASEVNQAWCFSDRSVLLVDGLGSWHFPQCVEMTLSSLKSKQVFKEGSYVIRKSNKKKYRISKIEGEFVSIVRSASPSKSWCTIVSKEDLFFCL